MPNGVAIFDLSETLIESDNLWANAFFDLVAELGISKDNILEKSVKEYGIDDSLSLLMDFYRVPYSLSDLMRKLAHHAGRRFNSDITLKPGAKELVAILRDKGYATVVVMPGNPTLMHYVRTHYEKELPMDKWISTREVNLAKNEPELYRSIADKFSLPLNKCILFEDLPEAIKSASRIGMNTVYISRTPIKEASITVPSLSDFIQKIVIPKEESR